MSNDSGMSKASAAPGSSGGSIRPRFARIISVRFPPRPLQMIDFAEDPQVLVPRLVEEAQGLRVSGD